VALTSILSSPHPPRRLLGRPEPQDLLAGRLPWILAGMLLWVLMILLRLFWLQVIRHDELLRRGIRPTALLMGADERVLNFRHTVPSGARLRNYAFVNVCARKWGLVTSAGRFVYFGPLPEYLRQRVRASAQVTAGFLASTKPGAQAGEILEQSKAWYAANGFPGEMELHHDSSPTLGDAKCSHLIDSI